MLINSITLHNFKSFEGTHHISGIAESLTSEKRIVLFGGLNGAGKTTILESILLCLYGVKNEKNLFPTRGAKNEDYQAYLVSILNNKVSTQLQPQMSVQIGFSNVEIGGMKDDMSVKRIWSIDTEKSRVQEQLEVFYTRSGETLQSYGEDAWQDFIEEKIPYEVAQFFFFDGEKIQDFVRDGEEAFASSLENILGLNIYKILREDLEKTRRDLQTENSKSEELKIQILKVDSEIENLEYQKRQSRQSIEDKQDSIEKINKRIQTIENETRRVTKIDAQNRDEYQKAKENLSEEKFKLRSQIEQGIKNLPFIINSKWF